MQADLKAGEVSHQARSNGAWPRFVARYPALAFTLCWVIIPNIPFSIFILYGGFPRAFFMVMYVLLGLMRRWVSFGPIACAYVVVTCVDILVSISITFNFSPLDMLLSLQYLGELDITQSAFYFGSVIMLAFSVVLTIILARSLPPRIALRHKLLPLCLLGTVVTTDSALNFSFVDPSVFSAVDGKPLVSAYHASGADVIEAGEDEKPDFVLIMVESLGSFRSDDIWADIISPIHTSDITDRFAVTAGHIPFAGHTTDAEMREFCDTRTPYQDIAASKIGPCLPVRLAAEGYDVAALHGFSGAMFDRSDWYPEIGFKEADFRRTLMQEGRTACSGVFPGVCDRALVEAVHDRLRAPSDPPKFIYALTLETHVPVIKTDEADFFECAKQVRLSPPMICNMAEKWRLLFEDIARVAGDKSLRPTNFLIVGDHPPPFYHRRARNQLKAGYVPWVYLEHKSAG